jgi:hypothetical protein
MTLIFHLDGRNQESFQILPRLSSKRNSFYDVLPLINHSEALKRFSNALLSQIHSPNVVTQEA